MARTAKSAPTARANSSTATKAPAKRAATKSTPKPAAGAERKSGGDSAHGGASRVLWKGAITFGLVLVPVELHTAARRSGLELDMLDKRSMEPIGYRRINKISGKEVPYEQIVKGYEYEKGRYVVLGDEDFKRANPKATQSVEIFSFVDAGRIPPMYFDTPYYLVPQRSGVKVYALLMQAMQKAGCVAIANVVIATRQHLAAVIPDGEKLMLNTLRYAEEIRDTGNLHMPDFAAASIKPAEMSMAQKLIESMQGEWEPAQYHDTYHEDLLARIDEKVAAGQLNEVPAPEKGGGAPRRSAEVIDLMSLLKKSIPAGGKPTARAAAKPRATKTVQRKRAA